MAKPAKPGKLSSSRPGKTYRLDMEGRTIVMLVGLLALTGIVIFYLGMLSGKGLRDANSGAQVAGLIRTQPATTATQPESLTFNQAINADNPAIDELKITEDRIAKRTEALLSRAERELVLEEVPLPNRPVAPAVSRPAASTRSNTRIATPTAPKSNPPAPVKLASSKSSGVYTVQVFSSQNSTKAQDLVSNLRRKGFDAYMNQFQAANNKTWFRVRVGRNTKSIAESLKQRLIREAKMKAPAVLRL